MKTPKAKKRSHFDGAKLDKALAVLIACTRTKKRPLPLTDIAGWLDVAVHNLGGLGPVAERIGITPKMLKLFSRVDELTPSVRALFSSRKLDSIDAANHLSMLPPSEQLKLARALARGDIDTSDVRAVVELRKRSPSKRTSLDRDMERVRASKTQQHYVAEFVIRGGLNEHTVRAQLSKYIPVSEIVSVEIGGAIGRLILTDKGKAALRKAAKAVGAPLKSALPKLLRTTS